MTLIMTILFHLNTVLPQLINSMGQWIYGGLFLIIFIETGLVIFPFLPGDSILFLCGSLAALPTHPLNFWVLTSTLIAAAVLGDSCNFEIGKRFGTHVLSSPRLSRWIKPKYLQESQTFFARHGSLAIFLGRFVPIIRTLIPFTAGISAMHYPTFVRYNLLGGIAWISIAIGTGFLFGNISIVQQNFELMMLLIVIISLAPVGIGLLKRRSVES
ncbi:VTT domain-containing protein [Lactiplantibacillus sp. DA1]|uniref:VTT domain-containing protein n=1 Tax=Lactiplantibacillus sp. DA1 TaxID=3079857 RepID=UPI00292A627A|nr:VTT domain-containing protein [Lactiplantibacillus sp. DA1]MDV0430759.1 VTT domain-containing protein [Lactiplantibacillus sp. DA1]